MSRDFVRYTPEIETIDANATYVRLKPRSAAVIRLAEIISAESTGGE